MRKQEAAGNFGAVLTLDPRTASDDELRAILQTLYAQRFVALRTPGLTKAEYIAFARRIGQPIPLSPSGDHHAEFPEIADLTNIGIDTRATSEGAAHWHTDQSFRATVSSVTMLYSVQAPATGGETMFCDMAAAYEALPATTQPAIESLVVEHRHGVSIVAQPGDHKPIPPRGWDPGHTVRHPLVRRHPITGQKTLYAITGTSQGIVGMTAHDGTQLLQALCDHAFQPRFINTYRHRPRDLLMWDNPTTMHSATPIAAATSPADTRLIHRISLRGEPDLF